MLVAARSEIGIPVSCVEQGRWNRQSAAFAAAPRTAYPELRRRKSEALLASRLERGGAQSEVWSAVDEKRSRHRVASATGAQRDVFEALLPDVEELRRSFPLQPGQTGAVLALAGAQWGEPEPCLDHVSRPDAFARLYPKLLDGYLLDAVERLDSAAVGYGELEWFVGAVAGADGSLGPSPGRGEDVRLRGEGVLGSGLVLAGELLQLSAFTVDGGRRRARPGMPLVPGGRIRARRHALD